MSNNNVIMMMMMVGDDKIKDSFVSMCVCERERVELIVSSCGETATYCGILGVILN